MSSTLPSILAASISRYLPSAKADSDRISNTGAEYFGPYCQSFFSMVSTLAFTQSVSVPDMPKTTLAPKPSSRESVSTFPVGLSTDA